MSKFRNRLMKRVMSVILSGAMVMSGMTSYAADVSYVSEEESQAVVSEDNTDNAEEMADKETDDFTAADRTQETTTVISDDDAEETDVTEPETEADNESVKQPETEDASEKDKADEADRPNDDKADKIKSEAYTETVPDVAAVETEVPEKESMEEESMENESSEETSEVEISEEAIDNVSAHMEIKAADWQFLAYGNGVNGKDTYNIDEKNGVINIQGLSGKIVPASNDGLAFVYTTVPVDKNFTFSANAHVNSWTYTNGQEGFGVMAADNVGPTGARIWNNSYQAVVSKIGYKWNDAGLSEDGTGDSVTMQLGVGSTEKVGVTQEDIDAFNANEIGQPKRFRAEQKALDTTYGKFREGQYNIVANYTNGDLIGSLSAVKDSEGKVVDDGHVLYEDFWLQVERNNTGYFVTYAPYKCELDEKGNPKTYKADDKEVIDGKKKAGTAIYALDSDGNKVIDETRKITQKYYDWDALSVLNNKYVFVGMFAARNADIDFTDIDLKESDPETDPEAEKRPIKAINLSRNVVSGSLTNTPDYTFSFASNWKGKLVVKDSKGEVLSRHTLTDENGKPILDNDGKEQIIDYYDVNGTLDPAVQYCQDGDDAKDTKVHIPITGLSIGKNVFTVEYTPERGWFVEEEEAVRLKSYDTVSFEHTVEYRAYGEEGNTIYVSQNGKATNLGTQDSPLDIYTAVQYALPGQTIILAGGTYSLNRKLEIPKTVSGEPAVRDENGNVVKEKEDYKNYIKMIGDPDKRTVLDFNGFVAAIVASGDFWYFQDFDVIRCKDGEKGVQVSGSYCVYDRINTYRNGSTGLQICRASGTDTYRDWPHDNLILNCNSYLNVDKGYEDADGFAAKLTSGSNNVFDGCIAAFNADDGWDLFAKAQTGSIGGVVIRNSIAYRNGYVLVDPDGNIKTPDEAKAAGVELRCVKGAGNGNGFKMGGDGLRTGSTEDDGYGKDKDSAIPNVGHQLYNSLSFGNKSKGFDSNSAPNIKVYNSISFNNDGANISFSTYDYVIHTDYVLDNAISIRSEDNMVESKVEPDVQQFADGYKTTHSINFMKEASGSSKSAAVYISLKNALDRKAKVKVWWSSKDADTDSQIVILSEKDVLLAEGDYSRNGALMISELETSGTEKVYLGGVGGPIRLYKVEITSTIDNKEEKDVLDISAISEYNKHSTAATLTRNGSYKLSSPKPKVNEIRVYYSAIPVDGIEGKGQQASGSKLESRYENDTAYYYRSNTVSKGENANKSGKQINPSDFETLEYPYMNTVSPENWRNEDGTIKTGDFLKLKPGAGSQASASIGGTKSPVNITDLIGEDTDGSVSGSTAEEQPSLDYGKDVDGELSQEYYGKVWAAPIKYIDYTTEEKIYYTGKKVVPEIHVRFSADPALLKEGKAYMVKFNNNVNASTPESKATAEIIGLTHYTGFRQTVEFEILPVPITDPTIAIPKNVVMADGTDPKKVIKPTWNGKALKYGKDFEIVTDPENPAKLLVKGLANFTGEASVNVYSEAAVSEDKRMSNAVISIVSEDKKPTYTGSVCEPRVEVKKKDGTLIDAGQYTVHYANNIEIGKATLIVEGDGVNYFGSKSMNFNITGGNLKDVAKVYYKTGAKKGQELPAQLDPVTFNGGKSCEIAVGSFEVKLANGTRLVKDIDYKVEQKGTTAAGSATLTIKGINNYKGAISYKYNVVPLDLGTDADKLVIDYAETIDYGVNGAEYVPGKNFRIKVKVDVNGNDRLVDVDSSNYRLAYKNNKVVGEKGSATVTVVGQKLLKGKIEKPFTVGKVSMHDNPDFDVSSKDVITYGKPLYSTDLKKAGVGLTQSVNGKKKKLSASRDYNKDEIEYYIDMDDDYELTEDVDLFVDTAVKSEITQFAEKGYVTVLVKVKAKEGSNYSDECVDYFRAAMWGVSKVRIRNFRPRIFGKNYKRGNGQSTSMVFDTEVAKIEDYIEIKYKTKNPTTNLPEVEELKCVDLIGAYTYDNSIFDSDGFAIVPDSYKKNDKVGTASFTIIGTGKYAGTKKVSFKIINKAVAQKEKDKNKDGVEQDVTRWESIYN